VRAEALVVIGFHVIPSSEVQSEAAFAVEADAPDEADGPDEADAPMMLPGSRGDGDQRVKKPG